MNPGSFLHYLTSSCIICYDPASAVIMFPETACNSMKQSVSLNPDHLLEVWEAYRTVIDGVREGSASPTCSTLWKRLADGGICFCICFRSKFSGVSPSVYTSIQRDSVSYVECGRAWGAYLQDSLSSLIDDPAWN